MPTSSQSQILSVVDGQLLQNQQQQKASGQTRTNKSPVRALVNQTGVSELRRRSIKEERRPSISQRYNDEDHSPPPPNVINRRRSSDKPTDVKLKTTRKSQRHLRCMHHDHRYPNVRRGRASQRADVLHMPVIYLNNASKNEPRSYNNDNRSNRAVNSYGRTKSTFIDPASEPCRFRGYSLNSENDEQLEYLRRLNQAKQYPISGEKTSSASDLDNANEDEDAENVNYERRASLLDDNARRLLVLGTIRPSKTFYRNLPDADAEHLMEYFRRMKQTQQRVTSEEINEELATKIVEYKPKMFFDSACVTKHQVSTVEKIVEQYADEIREQKAEFVKLDNPMRFVIRDVDSDKPLTTIPREYNDCFITLVTRSDPLRKSELISELVPQNFLEQVKANSLDISYFPGGVNYDVPHDDIGESGQMKLETYQKLKKRLNNRKVWYFSEPPEKRPNALLAIIPSESLITIDHQVLYDNLCDILRTAPNEQQIVSLEYLPLSCILNSLDMSNQFIVECDTNETKRQLMEKPLKIVSNKCSVLIELHSYDEAIQKEYEKFVKAEKYRELVKNHETAVRRTSTKQN
ncbi:unnamed protein product [Adineta ricciae]|uniref:Uncharacterized protein n=1 Tax=Adineta ricciae TaxID=249248 RepID=A0A814M436_ADIRI|nr:unnamed protein product [Adineta ricciae]